MDNNSDRAAFFSAHDELRHVIATAQAELNERLPTLEAARQSAAVRVDKARNDLQAARSELNEAAVSIANLKAAKNMLVTRARKRLADLTDHKNQTGRQ